MALSRTAHSRTSGEYLLRLPIGSILPRNGASRNPGTVHINALTLQLYYPLGTGQMLRVTTLNAVGDYG